MDPENNIKLPIIAFNMITTCVLMSAESQGSIFTILDRVRKSTQQDEELNHLSDYISKRWQSEKKYLPSDLQQFWSYMDLLSMESGLITYGDRIIIPMEMRPEMHCNIHEGHQGKEHCLLRARSKVF